MTPSQAEGLNGCIVIGALVAAAIAVMVGIATHDMHSALIVGLCLLAVAMTASLYITLGDRDGLGLHTMTSAFCTFALFVLQHNSNQTENWWWKLTWLWFLILQGIVLMTALGSTLESWRMRRQ